MEQSDEQLIAAYCAGERDALDVLVRRNLKIVYNFVYRFVGNTGDAKDIT